MDKKVKKMNHKKEFPADYYKFYEDRYRLVYEQGVAGDEDAYVELPNLPCWQKTWDQHLKELNDNQFSVVHKFESTNFKYGKCMCVILRKNLSL